MCVDMGVGRMILEWGVEAGRNEFPKYFVNFANFANNLENKK